jgi:hypothetical protein
VVTGFISTADIMEMNHQKGEKVNSANFKNGSIATLIRRDAR